MGAPPRAPTSIPAGGAGSAPQTQSHPPSSHPNPLSRHQRSVTPSWPGSACAEGQRAPLEDGGISVAARPAARTRGLAPQPPAFPLLASGSRTPDPRDRSSSAPRNLPGRRAAPSSSSSPGSSGGGPPGPPSSMARAAPGSTTPGLRGPRAPNFMPRARLRVPRPARLRVLQGAAAARGGGARLWVPRRGPARTCSLQRAEGGEEGEAGREQEEEEAGAGGRRGGGGGSLTRRDAEALALGLARGQTFLSSRGSGCA